MCAALAGDPIICTAWSPVFHMVAMAAITSWAPIGIAVFSEAREPVRALALDGRVQTLRPKKQMVRGRQGRGGGGGGGGNAGWG